MRRIGEPNDPVLDKESQVEEARKIVRRVLTLYTPHTVQREGHDSGARFLVMACGRQSGKSTFAINHILKAAWTKPGVYWFISPTYKQAKIIFRRMKRALRGLPKSVVGFNKTELSIEFENGGLIVCQSGRDYDNLRTETLSGCVIDEVRDQHPDLWSMVVQPMLRTTKGWCVFVSTPNGFDAFFDLAEEAKRDQTGEWKFITAESTCNPLFSQEEYDKARTQMSEAQFDQEIRAIFRDIHKGKAYKSAGEHNHRFASPWTKDDSLICPHLPLLLSPDFNLSPMTWEIGQFNTDTYFYFDEIRLEDSHTQEAASEFVARVLELKKAKKLTAVPNVIVAGDATSKAGQRAAAGKSDYDILFKALSEAGISFEDRTPDSNPMVKDRVNAFNAKLKAADGAVRFYYHPHKCKFLHKDLQRVSWKEGASFILDQVRDPSLTHASDGPGYSIMALTPIEGPASDAVSRVMNR